MSYNEPYFAPINNYSNTNKGMSADAVEAWLDQFPQKRVENKPNGGIIRSVADTGSLILREMNEKQRKEAVKKARQEHKQALKNLAKQDAIDAKEIAEQLKAWRKENAETAKTKPSDKLALTELGQKVFDELKDKGFYNVSDFPLSTQYIQKIVQQIRALGYEVGSVRQNRKAVQYVLNKQ